MLTILLVGAKKIKIYGIKVIKRCFISNNSVEKKIYTQFFLFTFYLVFFFIFLLFKIINREIIWKNDKKAH